MDPEAGIDSGGEGRSPRLPTDSGEGRSVLGAAGMLGLLMEGLIQ